MFAIRKENKPWRGVDINKESTRGATQSIGTNQCYYMLRSRYYYLG